MADPKTELNESLCCIALRYIDTYPTNSVDDFLDMITDDSGKTPTEFTESLKNIEIGSGNFRRHSTYRSAYGQKDKKGDLKYKMWIKGSFYSAQAIRKKLNVVLSQYIISRPDKEENNKAFVIKEKCASAIKNWAKVFNRSDVAKAQNWSPGILANLNSDKINIADIMLIHKNAEIYDELDEIQKITNDIKWKDISNNPSLIKKLLTPKKYNEYMNRAWLIKDIFNISLKQVLSENFPLKLINLDRNSAKEYDSDVDEFQFLLTSLVGAAKSGSLSDFENFIKKTIDLKPVIFSANDRLEVKYKLNIKNLNFNEVKSYDYTMWTNFGGGQHSVYFSQAGSGSASGEGGITLTYFKDLVKDIPKLRTFLTYMKLKRKEYFDAACKKYGVNFSDSKLGDSSLSDVKYNSTLYTSNDFKKLVHVLLTDTSYEKIDDVITPVRYKKIVGQIVIDNFIGTEGRGEKKRNIIKQISIPLHNKSLERVKCLEDFFSSYVNFLSNNNNSMGTYFGVSESYKKALKSNTKRMEEAYGKKYNDLILERLVTKIVKEEEKKNKTNRNMLFFTKEGKISEQKIKQQLKNNRELAAAYEARFKLLDREMKKFASEALKYKKSENKHIEESFKKSFALLANAEFGYMYSEYADKINELVKKQVLLSLYAAASGRGYIIFEGKKFEMEDYFDKDVKSAPYLKVGM